MTFRRPSWHAELVRNGRLDKALADYLVSLESTGEAADLSGIDARLGLLEALRLYGTGGITVTGSLEAGYRIHFNGSGTEVLAAQIFGG